MEIFVGIKRLFRIFGIMNIEHQNRKIELTINIFQRFVCFFVSTCFILSSMWFFFYRAKTFYEKSFSFTISITTFGIILMYSLLIWKQNQILKSFTQFESTIFERKYHIKMTLKHFSKSTKF